VASGVRFRGDGAGVFRNATHSLVGACLRSWPGRSPQMLRDVLYPMAIPGSSQKVSCDVLVAFVAHTWSVSAFPPGRAA
jgi:hypothetical protein